MSSAKGALRTTPARMAPQPGPGRLSLILTFLVAPIACISWKSAGGVPSTAGAEATGGAASGTAGNAGGGASSGGPGDGSLLGAGVRWIGRADVSDPAHPRFAWSGSGFVARFTGDALSLALANAGPFVFRAVVDGAPQPPFATTTGDGIYSVANGLAPGAHTVALYRQTEGVFGDSRLLALTVAGGTLQDPPPAPSRLIEVFGASVSCGYGDLGTSPCGFSFATESAFDTYAAIAARTLGAELSVVAISGRGVYRNADGTSEGTIPQLYDRVVATTLAAAPSTAPEPEPGSIWSFRATPQAVVINLGKNDLATGDPGTPFVDAYAAFAGTLRARYPGALIVAATGPNLGAAAHVLQVAYVTAAIAARRIAGDERIELLDWPEQTPAEEGCDGHPNAVKHQAMGAALAALLAARLGW
jgi:hypothetical protein